MVPVAAVLGGIEAVKGLAGLFKRRGTPNTKLEDAVAVVDEVVTSLRKNPSSDPEASKVLADHELELEREYTKQAAAALEVLKAEASSEDPWVRRARPAWLYAGMFVMIVQMTVFPYIGVKLTDFVDAQTINWFYTIVGSGYLGYGVLRTVDKNKLGIPGMGKK